MEKNKKKKFRDIRNAVVMMCVMIAMMSTASYAWFTMTDSPTVVGMQMTAASSSGGLLVGNSSTGDFYNAIEILDTDIKTLKPVTPDVASPGTFKEPVYTGNTVTSVTALESIDDYVAYYEYYLKSTGPDDDSDISIGIICGNVDQDGDVSVTDKDTEAAAPNLAGSLVRRAKDATTDQIEELYPHYAVRVGFVTYQDLTEANQPAISNLVVWEPNSDGDIDSKTVAGTVEGVTDTPVTADVVSKMVGTITTGGSNTTSDALFTIKSGKITKVGMYVWLEGPDEQCANEIQAGDLEAQIQFTIVDAEEAPTP